MIKIGFVESNDLLNSGMTMCLNNHPEMEVLFSTDCCQKLKSIDKIGEIDILVFDTCTDDDFIAIKQIQKEYPKLKFILLSEMDRLDENYLFYRANPGYVLLYKKIKLAQLIETIMETYRNNMTDEQLPDCLKEELEEKFESQKGLFTNKECTVLNLIGRGKTNREMSDILNVSSRTIESHRRRMIEKLGCKNIIPVILFALEKKYIQIDPDPNWFWGQSDLLY